MSDRKHPNYCYFHVITLDVVTGKTTGFYTLDDSGNGHDSDQRSQLVWVGEDRMGYVFSELIKQGYFPASSIFKYQWEMDKEAKDAIADQWKNTTLPTVFLS